MRHISGLEIKTLFIAFLVGIAHVISGVMVLVAPDAVFATPLASLYDIAKAMGFGYIFCGWLLVVAGAMAILGSSFIFKRHVHVSLFILQEALLLLQIWSISWALVEGRYPDGYTPVDGAWFILSDQIWAWILAVSHSIWLAAFIFRGVRRVEYTN